MKENEQQFTDIVRRNRSTIYTVWHRELMSTATIVMSIWLLIEIGFHLIAINADTGMWFVFYGGGTGAFIGVVAAWWIYRKMQKTNDEMIKQIEEISKE